MRCFKQSSTDQFIVIAKRNLTFRLLVFVDLVTNKEVKDLANEDLPKASANLEEIFPSCVMFDFPLLSQFVVEAENKLYFLKEFEFADFSLHDLMAHRKERNISMSTINALMGDIAANLTLLIMKRENILVSPEKIFYSSKIGKFLLADFYENNPKKFKRYLSKEMFGKLEISVEKYFESALISQPLHSLGLILLEVFMIGRCSPAFIKKTITSYANKEIGKIPLDPTLYSSYLLQEDSIKTFQSAIDICMNHTKLKSKSDYLVLTCFIDSASFRETLVISSFSAKDDFGLPSVEGELNFLDFSLSGKFVYGRPHGDFQINQETMRFCYGKKEDFLIKEEKMNEKNLSSILLKDKIHSKLVFYDKGTYAIEGESYSECIVDFTEIDKETTLFYLEKLLAGHDSNTLSLVFSSQETCRLNLKKIEKDFFFIELQKAKILFRVENFNFAALFEKIGSKITTVRFETFFPQIENVVHEMFFAENTQNIQEIVFKNATMPFQLFIDFFNVSSLVGVKKLWIEQSMLNETVHVAMKDYFNLPNITSLSIPGLGIKDAQLLPLLNSLHSIDSLNISGCELLGSEFLESLSQRKSLQYLDISFTSFEEDSLSILFFSLSDLEVLKAFGCKGLTDNILTIVCPDALKNIRELELGGTEDITDKGLAYMLQSEGGNSLKSLALKWMKNCGNETFLLIAQLKLQHLSLKGTSINSEGLKIFGNSLCMNSLKSLEISHTEVFANNGSSVFFGAQGGDTWPLHSLDISCTNIQDIEFSKLSSIANLKSLKARDLANVTEIGISKFLKDSANNESKIEEIDFSGNKISEEIFEDFGSLYFLKKVKIENVEITNRSHNNFFFAFPYSHFCVRSASHSDFLQLILNPLSFHQTQAFLHRFRLNSYKFFNEIEPLFSVINSSLMPLQELRELDLSFREDVYDNILVNLAIFESLANLKTLRICHAFVTDSGLSQIVQSKALPKLQHLDISSCYGISDTGIKEFYNTKTAFNLKSLLLDNLNISETGFLIIPKSISFNSLEFLSVNKCKNFSLKVLKELLYSKILGRFSRVECSSTQIDKYVYQKIGSMLEKKMLQLFF